MVYFSSKSYQDRLMVGGQIEMGIAVRPVKGFLRRGAYSTNVRRRGIFVDWRGRGNAQQENGRDQDYNYPNRHRNSHRVGALLGDLTRQLCWPLSAMALPLSRKYSVPQLSQRKSPVGSPSSGCCHIWGIGSLLFRLSPLKLMRSRPTKALHSTNDVNKLRKNALPLKIA